MDVRTIVSIAGDDFLINGRPTHEGRTFRGMRVEGLLLNSRMVQGVFDDLNPDTRSRWDYPDGPWDPERNTREFLAAMPTWRACGLDAFTINFQGGSPQGYSQGQPWHNSAFEADGTLRPDYASRMERIVRRADALSMAVILGLFYFGQDERLADEAAVVRACDQATDWVCHLGLANVLIEVNNECDVPLYEHEILQPPRVHELIERVIRRSRGRVPGPAGRLLVSTSMAGNSIPPASIVAGSDFVLLHGNGVSGASRLAEMVDTVRSLGAYRGQPVVFNEDDHFDFAAPDNHFLTAVRAHASWGLFDYRLGDEPFAAGFQCVPADWGIEHPRKRAFFDLLAEVTGQR